MDVLRPAVHRDRVVPIADGLKNCALGIELLSLLIVIGNLHARASPHFTRIGRQVANQQSQQGRFAGAIRSDQPDAITAHDRSEASRTIGRPPKALLRSSASKTTCPERSDASACRRTRPICSRRAARSFRIAIKARTRPSSLRAARFDSLAEPRLFLGELACRISRSGRPRCASHSSFLTQKSAVVAGPRCEASAIELDDAGGNLLQEDAIVRHKDHRARVVTEKRLEPCHRLDVQMVGRFVEEQQIRLRHEGAREKDTPAPSTREGVYDGIRRQLETREHYFNALLQPPAVALFKIVLQASELCEIRLRAVVRHLHGNVMVVSHEPAKIAEAVRHHVEHRAIVGEGHILHQPRHSQPWLPPYAACVLSGITGDDLQQRRFPRAVSPDYADTLARLDLEACSVEQREMAVGHRDVVERNERHGLARHVRPDSVEEDTAEILRFTSANAFDREQGFDRIRPQPRHLAQRCIVKNDVRRNPPRAGNFEPNSAKPLEQLVIDTQPRLGLDVRLGTGSVLGYGALPGESEARRARWRPSTV